MIRRVRSFAIEMFKFLLFQHLFFFLKKEFIQDNNSCYLSLLSDK